MEKGEIIAFPTDTVYGLGCRYDDEEGIEKIYNLKNRSIDKKLPVLCANLKQVKKIAEIDDNNHKLINLLNHFWPGPLTVVLNIKNKTKNYDSTIAIRIPNSKIALDLILKYGPLACTSCNISGEKEINTALEIKNRFRNKIDYVIDNIEERPMSKIPSTVMKYENNKIVILREGAIKKEELEKYV